ncbi:MAG: DNA polymerase III subunit gamma/tau [Planctomycetes bacterium]|nr:DNA polymerase III subunit gamma/tau [Planctomycetota bacterium]
MSYTVLARRYRSRSFDELVGQEPIARTLRNAIQSERTAHAYLFCGTRGVGKTSMARIFARELNVGDDLGEAKEIGAAVLRGEDLDVIEIDGASNRGIQEARDLIAGAGLSPTRCPYKIYIIDEVHMLTREAFNALLKTMEEPPAHVKFILCTTDPQKVPATIQSRCQRFDFRAIATSQIAAQLHRIVEAEGLKADDSVIQQVARLGHGSMRDALSLLDRLLAAADGELTADLAEDILGLPHATLVGRIVDAIIARDVKTALESGAEILGGGASVEQALDMLAEHLHSLMILVACGADSELVELAPDARETASRQAGHFDVSGLVYLIALCDSVGRNARGSAAARALFDAALVRMCHSEHYADVRELLAAGSEGKKKRGEVASAPVPVPAPAPAPAPVSAPAPASASPDLWTRVLEVASLSPADEAKVRPLELKSVDGRTLRLAVSPGAAASARYLRTMTDRIAELVERATGQRMKVEIEAPAESADEPAAAPVAPAATAQQLTEVRGMPIVRRAMEIFDAAVVDVTDDAPAEREESTDV